MHHLPNHPRAAQARQITTARMGLRLALGCFLALCVIVPFSQQAKVSTPADFGPQPLTAAPQANPWTTQMSGTANNLFSVHFVSASEGWAVGGNNTILHTTNGGANWTAQTNQGGVPVSSYLGVRFIDANTGWAGGGSAIVRTTDGGSSWVSQTATQDGRFRNNLFAVSASAAWIPAQNSVSSSRWFSRYTVGGGEENFNVLGGSSQYFDIYFTDANNGWAVGTGPIVHITNGSSASPSFGFQTSCPCPTLFGLHMLNSSTGWAVGASGLILKTTDSGSTWVSQTSNTTTTLRSVHFIDANQGWAVGASGLILRSTDGGASWAQETSGTSVELRRVFFVNANTGYAVGLSGTILKRSVCTAPSIDTPLSNQAVCAGSSASFTVQASGSDLTYQWRKGGAPLSNGGNISGADTATLTINPASAMDAGSYDVVVTGSCGMATSDAATLTINAAPAINDQPASLTRNAGQSATFMVTATGAGLTYQWRKNTNPISGATASSYTIASTSASDAGSYDVVVSGTCAPPVTSNAATLTVLGNEPPTITAAAPLTRQQGSPAGAAVQIATVNDAQDAPGTLAVTTIAGGTATGITVGSISNAGGTVTATVAASCSATSGTVRLQVSDSNGATATADLQINVTAYTTPSISNHPASQTKCVGNPVTFSVDASGGTLTYQWRKGGNNIAGATNSSYSIASVSASDAGSYDVVVSGACDSVTSSAATLTVPVITVSPASLLNGTQGTAYSQSLSASGGAGAYMFAVTSGTLPDGLMLSTAGGISGTPTTAGNFNFTVTATDANNCTGSQSYAVTIAPQMFTLTVNNAGGGTVTSSPAGINCGATCSAAFNNGTVVTLTATADSGSTFTGWSNGCTGTGNCTVTMDGAKSVTANFTRITLSPPTLPGGAIGTSYNQTISASGGTSPYTFTVTSGALPPGLTLSSAGTLSGTPTATGSYGFSVTATDATNRTGSGSYTLSIDSGWKTTGSMSTGRRFGTATLLANGKVLATGGLDSGASAELYDSNTGLWSATGSMTVARNAHTATLLRNGKVLVVGGQPGLGSAELYDPATGTWSSTGSLGQGRYLHTATLLPDGRVLVAGGFVVGVGPIASAEIYNPANGLWSGVNNMLVEREAPTATLLANGKVLVTGGAGGGPTIAELFDPANGTWTRTADMHQSRAVYTATRLPDGRVLVAGGEDGATVTAAAELFDPAGNGGAGSWTVTASLNTARRSHTASLLPNGKVLVTGGYQDFNTYFASTELFDPAGNGGLGAWSVLSPLNTPHAEHVAVLLPSGTLLIACGGSAITELYNPAAGSWTLTGSMSQRRAYQRALLLANGKVLVMGGYNSGDLNSVELYDPATGLWSSTGSLNVSRLYHTATLLPNGKVLVAGGRDNNGTAVASAELYDPSTGTWSNTASMSTPRLGHTATLLANGKVLVVGGQGLSGNLSSSELFDPAGNGGLGTWTPSGTMNGAHVLHTATLLPGGDVLVAGGLTELYDSVTGQWRTSGSLTTQRSGHTATLLPNGKVMVAGGQGSSLAAMSSVEIYDPAIGQWSPTGSLAFGRQEHAATLLIDGRVLVAGGHDSTSEGIAIAELFDPAMGMWQTTASTHVARRAPSLVLLPGGKVLIAGGTNFTSGSLDSAELYDIGLGFDNAWRPVLSTVSSPLTLGTQLAASGSLFQGISEASGGGTENAATNYPLVQILSLTNEQRLFLLSDAASNWSSTAFTSRPLPVLPPGYALVTVFANGIPSASRLTLVNCSFAISPSAQSFTALGGSDSLSVAASSACNWTATSNAGFITLTAGGTGSGNGTVTYQVAANTGQARTGTLTVAGYTFTVTQAACVAASISTQPSNQTVCAGSMASFSVAAAGTGLTYRWRKGGNLLSDGGNISGATTNHLTINPTTANDAGNYDVVVTGTCGNATSDTVTLTVNTAPGITNQPTNQTACAGGGATFTAAANGTPNPAVQWQVSTDGGATFNDLAGKTSTTLMLTSVTVSQSGNRYRAVFSNSCGSAISNAGVLTVNGFSLSSSSQSFSAAGGSGSVNVITAAGCAWAAVSNAAWITITSGASGSGNGTVNYAVDQNVNVASRTGTLTIAGLTFTVNQAGIAAVGLSYQKTDFDSDNKTDLGFYRVGLWGVLKSLQSYSTGSAQFFSWGGSGLQPIVGDFDGDGKADIGYIVPPSGGQSATFAILLSSHGYSFAAGQPLFVPAGFPSLGDTPIVGDVDGDGKADPGIWRATQGIWIIPTSSSNYTQYVFAQWGQVGDVPLLADFDQDGKADFGFYRDGLWGVLKSTQSYDPGSAQFFSWGGSGLQPIVGDFDGDGKADIGYIVPPSGGQSATFAILLSSHGYSFAAGQPLFVPAGFPSLGDTPIVGDFDGDGKADPGIWRESQGIWIIPKSSSNYTQYIFSQWGQSGDIVFPNTTGKH